MCLCSLLFGFVASFFCCLLAKSQALWSCWCWSSSFPYAPTTPHPTPCLLIHVFPLFGSGISSPGLTSQVCLLHRWLAVSPFLAHLFHNPSQFLYFILYMYTFPTHPLWFQGRSFVKLLEIVLTAYFIGFPQYSRYTKVHSGDGICPKLRWRKNRGKRLTQTRGRGGGKASRCPKSGMSARFGGSL